MPTVIISCLGLRLVWVGSRGGQASVHSDLSISQAGAEMAMGYFCCPCQGDLFTTLQGGICPVQAAEGANAQVLTWASCCPASVDTCRSLSQSTLFPRRRMTTPSDPESCTQNTFPQPHRLSACCVPGPGWVWPCLPRSWPCASFVHAYLSMSHSLHALPTSTLSPPSVVRLPLLSACKHDTHFPRLTPKVPPPGSLPLYITLSYFFCISSTN